jgi:hypothetical protein
MGMSGVTGSTQITLHLQSPAAAAAAHQAAEAAAAAVEAGASAWQQHQVGWQHVALQRGLFGQHKRADAR